MSELPVVHEGTRPVAGMATLTTSDVTEQVRVIQEVMGALMHEGEHFGIIPGCGDKPVLLKAGAEKLSLLFRLAPRFDVDQTDFPGGHREYRVTCNLYHIATQAFCGQGVGLCSTMETKYRWRQASRHCPTCGTDAIIKGKAEYGGGWICFAKKGGCGAKFKESDPEILSQPIGRAENEDLADVYNTVLKMAKKRAHVDAILTATAASDIFAQDIEDLPESLRPHDPAENRRGTPAPEAEPEKKPSTGGSNGSTSAGGPVQDTTSTPARKRQTKKGPGPERWQTAPESVEADRYIPARQNVLKRLRERHDEADPKAFETAVAKARVFLQNWPADEVIETLEGIKELQEKHDEYLYVVERMRQAVRRAETQDDVAEVAAKLSKAISEWSQAWRRYAISEYNAARSGQHPKAEAAASK